MTVYHSRIAVLNSNCIERFHMASQISREFESPCWCSIVFKMVANHLREYAHNLNPSVKKHYYEKISSVGIGPILIPDKAYDPDCLPRVESLDFRLSFLVLETSSYGKDQSFSEPASI